MTAGWDEIELHGASLRLVMLPDKGAEIISLLDRATEIELLARLRPTPRNDGTINAHGNEFDRWYAGGWQLIIPNGDRACRVDDVEHPFHGEAWARSFEVTSLSATEASLTVELATLPLRIDRRVTVDEVDPLVTVTTTVTNTGERPARVLWGEHPAFGGPVLGEGARLQLPPCLVESASVDSRSRLVPVNAARWPVLETTDGGLIDLSYVPARTARSHDVCITHALSAGWYELRNAAVGLGVRVTFDLEAFPRLWLWQLYGAADDEPFRDGYCLAVEPFSGPPCLADALVRGEAAAIAPGESWTAWIAMRTFPC